MKVRVTSARRIKTSEDKPEVTPASEQNQKLHPMSYRL